MPIRQTNGPEVKWGSALSALQKGARRVSKQDKKGIIWFLKVTKRKKRTEATSETTQERDHKKGKSKREDSQKEEKKRGDKMEEGRRKEEGRKDDRKNETRKQSNGTKRTGNQEKEGRRRKNNEQ